MARSKTLKRNPQLGVSPEGMLLEFALDLNDEFGFAYERFLNFEKSQHSHERFVFCAARVNCEFKVTEVKTGKVFLNSKTTTVFKAPRALHHLKCEALIYENLVFLPTVAKVRAIFDERGYERDQWTALTIGIRELKRSTWFDALTERYFQKKIFSPDDRESLRVLENEILREVLVMALGEPGTKRANSQSSQDKVSRSIQRAVEAIELSLFSELKIDQVAKTSGLSRATLMRTFQRELKTSPMAYARQRRLEEAKRLLAKNAHSVTEVSYLVGYNDTSAFCRAFKTQFGTTPKNS